MWNFNVFGSGASILGLGLSIYALLEVRKLKAKTRSAIANAIQKQRMTFALVEIEKLLSEIAESQRDTSSLMRVLSAIRRQVASLQHSEFLIQAEREFFRRSIVDIHAIRRLDDTVLKWLMLLESHCQGLKQRLLLDINAGDSFDV